MVLKKIFGVVLLLSIFVVGCSSEEKTYDKAFLKDLKKGLSDRWDANAQQTDKSEDEQREVLIQLELDRISSYTSKKFEDTKLQEKAIAYINLLNKQKEALTYYNADYEKYGELWDEAYDDRTKLIKEFIDTYNLEFPDRHSDTVNEMITNAKLANDADDLEEKIKQMTDAVVFSKVKTSGDYAYYEAIIENITDKTFEYFSLDVNLLDAEGVIIESNYTSVDNFAPGKKAKLEFSTDTRFEKYEITVDYYVE